MPPANAWLGGTVSSLSFAPVAYAPGSPERDRVSMAEQFAHPNNSAKAGSSARVLGRSTALPRPTLQNPLLSADVKPQGAMTSRLARPGKETPQLDSHRAQQQGWPRHERSSALETL